MEIEVEYLNFLFRELFLYRHDMLKICLLIVKDCELMDYGSWSASGCVTVLDRAVSLVRGPDDERI